MILVTRLCLSQDFLFTSRLTAISKRFWIWKQPIKAEVPLCAQSYFLRASQATEDLCKHTHTHTHTLSLSSTYSCFSDKVFSNFLSPSKFLQEKRTFFFRLSFVVTSFSWEHPDVISQELKLNLHASFLYHFPLFFVLGVERRGNYCDH